MKIIYLFSFADVLATSYYIRTDRYIKVCYKGKDGIWNCNCYRTVTLLEHGMKMLKLMFKKGFVEW